MGIIAVEPLLRGLSPAVLILIAVGGKRYSVGVVFHALQRLPTRTRSGAFVLAAAMVHFAAVSRYGGGGRRSRAGNGAPWNIRASSRLRATALRPKRGNARGVERDSATPPRCMARTGGRKRIEEARAAPWELVGGEAKLVTFTSGGTRTNNTVLTDWASGHIVPTSFWFGGRACLGAGGGRFDPPRSG
jgi:hypothetical protein